jgi:glutamate racemase
MHIGLFDSGVGGLTVLSKLKERISKARFTYLGDTARLPYGNKAPETLERYTKENIEFLDQQSVDAIVVACHSASSVALKMLQSPKGTPIFNVIAPSCEQAIKHSKNKKVGVVSTKATARSLVYPNYINSLDEKVEVISQECPLLVPLVEEGMINDPITDMMLSRYLKEMITEPVDTLILGCTHYPLLKEPISKICGASITLIDPAESVAGQILDQCEFKDHEPGLKVFLTDHAPHFINHAKQLLGSLDSEPILFPKSQG